MARQAKASYYIENHRYYVHRFSDPPKKVHVFKTEREMVEWSHDNRIVLKDACYRPGWR